MKLKLGSGKNKVLYANVNMFEHSQCGLNLKSPAIKRHHLFHPAFIQSDYTIGTATISVSNYPNVYTSPQLGFIHVDFFPINNQRVCFPCLISCLVAQRAAFNAYGRGKLRNNTITSHWGTSFHPLDSMQWLRHKGHCVIWLMKPFFSPMSAFWCHLATIHNGLS